MQIARCLIYLLALALALAMAGCASKAGMEETSAVLGEPADEQTMCYRTLWAVDGEPAERAEKLMDDGNSLARTALELRDEPAGMVRVSAGCVQADQVRPELAEEIAGLELGQTAGPLDMGRGKAWITATTNRYYLAAKQLFREERYAEAMPMLRSDLALNQDNVVSWHLLASALIMDEEPDEALETVDQGLAWDPDNPSLLAVRAMALGKLGRNEEALEDLRKAASLSGDSNPAIDNNLAWALLQQDGSLAEAELHARRAVKNDPKNPSYWDTLGRIRQAKGDPAGAVVCLHRAMVLGQGSVDVDKAILDNLVAMSPREIQGQRDTLAGMAPAGGAQQPKAARPAPLVRPAPQKPREEPVKKPLPRAWTQPTPPQALSVAAATAAAPAAARPETQAQPEPRPAPEPAPEPAPAPAKPQASTRVIEDFFLQVSSMRSYDNAQAEVMRWRDRGYRARARKFVDAKGYIWYRVLLGPLPSRVRAHAMYRQLADAGLVREAVVVTIPRD